MRQTGLGKDTPAWILQVWAAFIISTVGTGVGIFYLEGNSWQKAFVGMGYVFSVSSTFTLAKTIRDNQDK
ncbi:MAG TPA: YiaA/YiaB family inner membrane protein [Nodularia sp. (in: cyanobacteria)]|nr:YiaA/YiaB family inner membrane protein [Nodularia sp. (in: cyanobacteria)]